MPFNPKAEMEKAGQALLDAAYEEQDSARELEAEGIEKIAEFMGSYDDYDMIPDDQKEYASGIMEKIKRAMFAKVARDTALKEYTTARRYVEAYESNTEQYSFDEKFADILSTFKTEDFNTEDNTNPRFIAGSEGTQDSGNKA